MAVIEVIKEESFGQWRQKFNQLSENVGDLDLLITPVDTDLVAAINSLSGEVDGKNRETLIRAIGMA